MIADMLSNENVIVSSCVNADVFLHKKLYVRTPSQTVS